MSDVLATRIKSLSSALDGASDYSDITFVLYRASGVADGRVNIDTPVYVLLAKRKNAPHGVIGNCAFAGELNTDKLPSCVSYLGQSSFDKARLVFGDR